MLREPAVVGIDQRYELATRLGKSNVTGVGGSAIAVVAAIFDAVIGMAPGKVGDDLLRATDG